METYYRPPAPSTPSSTDRDAFASAMARSVFRGKVPHFSTATFSDRTSEELRALRRGRKQEPRDDFDRHLSILAKRLAELPQ